MANLLQRTKLWRYTRLFSRFIKYSFCKYYYNNAYSNLSWIRWIFQCTNVVTLRWFFRILSHLCHYFWFNPRNELLTQGTYVNKKVGIPSLIMVPTRQFLMIPRLMLCIKTFKYYEWYIKTWYKCQKHG